jgi:GDP-L-fucose synthase
MSIKKKALITGITGQDGSYLADSYHFLMQNYSGNEFVNIGVGEDISIKKLALLIKDIVRYKGQLEFDTTKPDGTPQKLLDVNNLHNLGWQAKISLREGISSAYKWFKENKNEQR